MRFPKALTILYLLVAMATTTGVLARCPLSSKIRDWELLCFRYLVVIVLGHVHVKGQQDMSAVLGEWQLAHRW